MSFKKHVSYTNRFLRVSSENKKSFRIFCQKKKFRNHFARFIFAFRSLAKNAKISRKKWKLCKKCENFAKNTEFLKINAKFSEKVAKVGWTELDDILKFQKSFFFSSKIEFFKYPIFFQKTISSLHSSASKLYTGCPKKHGNSVTNSISSFQIIL